MLDVIIYAVVLIGFASSLLASHFAGIPVLTSLPDVNTPNDTLFFTVGVIVFVVALMAFAYKIAKWRYHKPIVISKDTEKYDVNVPMPTYGNISAGDRLIKTYEPGNGHPEYDISSRLLEPMKAPDTESNFTKLKI